VTFRYAAEYVRLYPFLDPSADEIKRIMMVHGGTFHTYLSHKTTHIIAKNLPDTKVKIYIKFRLSRLVLHTLGGLSTLF